MLVLVALGGVALLPYFYRDRARVSGLPSMMSAGVAFALSGFVTKLVSDDLSAHAWFSAWLWADLVGIAAVVGVLSENTALQTRPASQVAPLRLQRPDRAARALGPAARRGGLERHAARRRRGGHRAPDRDAWGRAAGHLARRRRPDRPHRPARLESFRRCGPAEQSRAGDPGYHESVLSWTRFVVRNRRKFLLLWARRVRAGRRCGEQPRLAADEPLQRPGLRRRAGPEHHQAALPRARRRAPSRSSSCQAGDHEQRSGVPRGRPAGGAARGRSRQGRQGRAAPAAGDRVAYAQITTPSRTRTPRTRPPRCARRSATCPGATTYLSGGPAINHDTQPISNDDLAQGRADRRADRDARAGVHVRHARRRRRPARCSRCSTIPTALGIVWVFANFIDMPIYVQNMATLIGLAIAIDYSMFVVFRFREELERNERRARSARAHDEPRPAARRSSPA